MTNEPIFGLFDQVRGFFSQSHSEYMQFASIIASARAKRQSWKTIREDIDLPIGNIKTIYYKTLGLKYWEGNLLKSFSGLRGLPLRTQNRLAIVGLKSKEDILSYIHRQVKTMKNNSGILEVSALSKIDGVNKSTAAQIILWLASDKVTNA